MRLVSAAFDRAALSPPEQHAAGQIGYITEASLLQDFRCPGGAATGPAYGNNRLVSGELAGTIGKTTQGYELGAGYAAQWAAEFLCLTDIEDLVEVEAIGDLDLTGFRKSVPALNLVALMDGKS